MSAQTQLQTRRYPWGFLLLAPWALAFLLVSGCATKPVITGSRYVVTAPKTAFYKYGPAQSMGPDTTLPQGAIVTMLESTWGFCHVMTEGGMGGYVSSDDLKLAPTLPPPKNALAGSPRITQPSSGRPKQNLYLPTPGGPLFDVNDVPLPSGMTDTLPASNPKFRY